MIAEDTNEGPVSTRCATTALIGVGNDFRGDDGLGLLMAREIASRDLRRVKVVEANGDGASLMRMWQGIDHLLLVDAMKLGFPPGSIHRIDASENKIPVNFFTYSSHAFGVGQAIEMARQLHQLPRSVIIYGMEGERFDFCTGLSGPLAKNFPMLIRMVMSELHGWKES